MKPDAKMEYGGYEIVAQPHQLAHDGTWSLNIKIREHLKSGIKSRHYSTNNKFATQEEALERCFLYGKKIIDGDIKPDAF
jgi:hypothetical protein